MSSRRIPSLDGIRAISISLVVLSHLVKWHHVSLAFSEGYGTLGVRVFFVLSGYLITNLLLDEHRRTGAIDLKTFYLRRGYRIFPAALVFVFVAVALYWHQLRWYHVLAALFYVANMDVTRPWMFGHLWSLSIEEQFYLLWPFAIRRWYGRRTAILIGVLLAAAVFRTALYALRVHSGIEGSLPLFADQLAIGCLLAVLAPRLPRVPKYAAALMLLAVAFIPWFPANTPARTIFMLFVLRPALNVSLAGLVLHVIQFPYRALNWAPVAWLGKISYSVYLWQELFCSNPTLHLGYSLLVPVLACACLSYYLVEKPALRLRDSRIKGKAQELCEHACGDVAPARPIGYVVLQCVQEGGVGSRGGD